MSNLINVTSFTSLSKTLAGTGDGPTAVTKLINVSKIVDVKTRLVPYLTTGITDIIYKYEVNNMSYLIPLIVTEALSVIQTTSNANAIAT
jgi:hypothetical protein